MRSPIRALAAVTAALLGGLAVVFGEQDDSPGLQGLGLILIGLAVWIIRRRNS